jgi:hypothetical protein
VWLDADQLTGETTGALSGGERRVLAVVAALLGERSIDLGDIAAGVDRGHLQLVLAALAHAGGSHQHSDVAVDTEGRPAGFVQLGTLYPWPGQADGLPGPIQQGAVTQPTGVRLPEPGELATRLARARQQLATQAGLPDWDELTDDERQRAAIEAKHYLEAAAQAGLAVAAIEAGD